MARTDGSSSSYERSLFQIKNVEASLGPQPLPPIEIYKQSIMKMLGVQGLRIMEWDNIGGEFNVKIASQFNKAWAAFIKEVPSGQSPNDLWAQKFAGQITVAQSDMPPGGQSFEAAFKKIFPNSTAYDFKTAFCTFFAEVISAKGYFVASEELDHWKGLLDGSIKEAGAVILPENKEYQGTAIIFYLLTLIMKFQQCLQKVTQTQAAILMLSVSKQQLLSNRVSQIRSFFQGDSTKLGGTSADDGKARGEANEQINAETRTQIQQQLSTEKDRATALNTRMNQVNQAVIAMLETFNEQLRTMTKLNQFVQQASIR